MDIYVTEISLDISSLFVKTTVLALNISATQKFGLSM